MLGPVGRYTCDGTFWEYSPDRYPSSDHAITEFADSDTCGGYFRPKKKMPPTEKAATRPRDPDESSAGDPVFPPCPIASIAARSEAPRPGETVGTRRTTASGHDPTILLGGERPRG
jgi:hypothetical protein